MHKILLVEDQEINTFIFEKVLSHITNDIELRIVTNLNELESLHNNDELSNYDIIFMDQEIIWWKTNEITKILVNKQLNIIWTSLNDSFAQQVWLKKTIDKSFPIVDLISLLQQ